MVSVASSSVAQDESGGTSTVFQLGPTARGVGIGAPMVGLANDASAPFWNPALLKRVPGSQLAISHNRLISTIDGATYQYAGLVVPTMRAGGFGLGLMRFSLGGIEGFDENSQPTGTFDYSETQLLLSYGQGFGLPLLGGTLDLGLTAKLHSLQLKESATSGGMDVGLSYAFAPLPALRLSAAYQDLIAPSFRLVELEDEVPWTQRYSLTYGASLGPGRVLDVGLAFERPEFADGRVGAGAELRLNGLYAGRVGYGDGAFSAGLGGRWRGYALDFAFRTAGDLGSSQFISFTWHFGSDVEERQQRLEDERQAELQRAREEAVVAWTEQQSREAVAEAQHALANDDLETASWAITHARTMGADAKQIETLQRQLAEAQARVAVELQDAQERQARISEASLAVRSSLDAGDALVARRALERLERLDPDHPLVGHYRAEVDVLLATAVAEAAGMAADAEARGDWRSALQGWAAVARLDPEHPGPQLAVERWRAEVEAAETAVSIAEAQLEIERLYADALESYGQQRLERAGEQARVVLALAPDHRGARMLLVRIDEAQAGERVLSPEEEAQVRRFYLNGLAHFTKDDYGSAIAAWEKILEIDPANEGALSNIREAQARLRQLQPSEGTGSDARDR